MSKRPREDSSKHAVSSSNNRNSNSSNSNKPHIHFLNGGNKVTYVRPPPKSDNPSHWFTERMKLVQRPIHFTIPPMEPKKNNNKKDTGSGKKDEDADDGSSGCVNIDIDTSVKILSVALAPEEDKKEDQKSGNKKDKSQQRKGEAPLLLKATLEVASPDLAMMLGIQSVTKTKKGNVVADKKGPAFFAVATIVASSTSSSSASTSPSAASSSSLLCAGDGSSAESAASALNNAATRSAAAPPPQLESRFASTRVGLKLTEGSYLLRNTGNCPLTVFAMATDHATQLV